MTTTEETTTEPTTFERVRAIIVEYLGIDQAKVVLEAKLIEDLEADSLDMVELTMAVEESFGVDIPDESADAAKTVADIVALLDGMKAKAA